MASIMEVMLLHMVVVMEEGMEEVAMVGTGEEEEGVTEDMAAMEEEDMTDTEVMADRAEAEVSQCLSYFSSIQSRSWGR